MISFNLDIQSHSTFNISTLCTYSTPLRVILIWMTLLYRKNAHKSFIFHPFLWRNIFTPWKSCDILILNLTSIRFKSEIISIVINWHFFVTILDDFIWAYSHSIWKYKFRIPIKICLLTDFVIVFHGSQRACVLGLESLIEPNIYWLENKICWKQTRNCHGMSISYLNGEEIRIANFGNTTQFNRMRFPAKYWYNRQTLKINEVISLENLFTIQYA